MTRRQSLDYRIGALVTQVGRLIIAAAGMGLFVVIIAWQIINQLRFGQWVPVTTAEGLGYLGIPIPRGDGAGAQRVIDWLLAAPLSLSALVVGGYVGLVVMGCGIWISEAGISEQWPPEGWRKEPQRH